MDPAKKVLRQDLLPLLKCDQHHCRPVCHDQPGVILTGFDIENVVKIHFHVSTILADKEKRLHLLRFWLGEGFDPVATDLLSGAIAVSELPGKRIRS